jgi:hypothetical protein
VTPLQREIKNLAKASSQNDAVTSALWDALFNQRRD